MLEKLENENTGEFLNQLTHYKGTVYSPWKVKSVFKRLKRQIALIKGEDGTSARSNKQKAQLFAEYLNNTFSPC